MGNYGKRRRDWAVKQSLDAMGWKTPAAVFGKFGGLVILALVAFWLVPGDLWSRAAYSLLIALAGGVAAPLILLAFYWIAAPAALDAEKQAQIEDLIGQIEASKVGAVAPPYGITREARERMLAALSKVSGEITIDRTVDAADADPLYRQVKAVFASAGWSVDGGITYGDEAGPDSGVTLIVGQETNQDHAKLAQFALNVGGLDLVEKSNPALLRTATRPMIVFSSRDANFRPAARWG